METPYNNMNRKTKKDVLRREIFLCPDAEINETEHIMDFLTLEQSVWSRLKEETRPIVLYGMGDGADKILAQFDRLGIRASGVFASDEFARGNLFHGFSVRKLSDTTAELGEDIVIVISFASQRPEVLAKMYELDVKYDVVAPDVPVVPGPLLTRRSCVSTARTCRGRMSCSRTSVRARYFSTPCASSCRAG